MQQLPGPVPRPIQLLTKSLSWNKHSPSAINHKWAKASCRHFIWMLNHLKLTRGRRRPRESHSSPPSCPSSSTPHQRSRTHRCALDFQSTLTIALHLLTLCIQVNEFSINTADRTTVDTPLHRKLCTCDYAITL